MEITADSVKPKKRGQSDFFSWKLYQWLKRFPGRTLIWRATWNSATGIDPKVRPLYIGDPFDHGWIHARLLRNLCLHGSRIEAYAYGPDHDTANWEDVTGEFWEKYLRIGVCAIHENAHQFIEEGDVRVCSRCGEKQVRKTSLVERVSWESVSASTGKAP